MESEIFKNFINLCSKEEISKWVEERKFDKEVLKQLKIGLCTLEVYNKLLKQYGGEKLKEVGLADVKGRNKYYNRIIIPYSEDYFAARSQDRTLKKYRNLFPKGLKKIPYIIKGNDNNVFVVEGETDAIRLKHEFPECNIFSLGGAKSKSLLKILLKEFKNHTLKLCLDNDEPGKEATQEIIHNLKKLQATNNCEIIKFKGKDIDDYYLNKSPNDELSYEKVTLIPLKEESWGIYKEQALSLYLQNKEDIAERFYEICPYFYDDIGLFWFWNKKAKCYEMKDEYEVMNNLKRVAKEKMFQITQSSFWNECLRSLKLVGRSKTPKPFKKTWIQFYDEVYDYETQERFDATHEYFNVNPIPHKLSDKEQTPVIDKLLEEWVGKDYIKTLKECIGLAMLQDYPLHRIIYLHGRGLNGKGCFLRLMIQILGKNNICSSNLTKLLKSNFECSKLYKKLACLMGETDFSILKDTSLLKQLTGQDLVSAEYKGKNSFDFENFATLFISSNSLPITLDKTIGFYRRPFILDFPNSFKEGEDPIKQIPLEEYSNICFAILKLIPNLIKRGKFDKDGDLKYRKNKYEELSNPLLKFLKENYKRDISIDTPFFEFYDKFKLFCVERGFRELTKKNVSQLLDDNGFETKRKDVKQEDGSWKQWYHIIGLKEVSDSSDSSDRSSNQYAYKKNGVDPQSERSERYEIIDPFEQKLMIHTKCTVQDCNNYECNIDSENKPFCEEHWETHAKR